jgi:hypothetical protein
MYMTREHIVDPNAFEQLYDPICDYYDLVLSKYARDLLELPAYLVTETTNQSSEPNYALTQIFQIMRHTFAHTMSVNLINTITLFLASSDKGTSQKHMARIVYQSMETSGFITYCTESVPRKVIKSVCKISERSDDPETTLTVRQILDRAIDLLATSRYDGIDPVMCERAKETVVPFFVTYMEAYTAEMHRMIIKQCKSMIRQNELLAILRHLAKKAISEQDTFEKNPSLGQSLEQMIDF